MALQTGRRTFLKRGLFGGALLAIGGSTTLALFPSRQQYSPTGPLKVLSPGRFNVLAAMAARFVTAPGADPVTIAHKVDDSLARAVPEAQKDVGQVLDLIENGFVGLMFDGRPKPFTRLDPEAQDRALYAWRDSKLVLRRGAYKAMKNLCTTSFYRTEKAWLAAGYPGPPDYLLALGQPAPTPEVTP